MTDKDFKERYSGFTLYESKSRNQLGWWKTQKEAEEFVEHQFTPEQRQTFSIEWYGPSIDDFKIVRDYA